MMDDDDGHVFFDDDDDAEYDGHGEDVYAFSSVLR